MAPTTPGSSVMRYFCTYFDRSYWPRGLALYRSLQRHCPAFQLWVLCMDRVCYDVLAKLGLAGVHPIALDEYEKGDEDLLRAKQNRTPIEYYFTCSPSLPLFVLERHPQADLITYLDADLYFFADPSPIYEEIGRHSIAIIGHRFPPHLQDWERYGIYNVGWVSFRRDAEALVCLRWWRERCLEWCYDRCEDSRFADQKYLDDWPSRFQGVAVLQHKGANLAPWNLANYTIREAGNRVGRGRDRVARPRTGVETRSQTVSGHGLHVKGRRRHCARASQPWRAGRRVGGQRQARRLCAREALAVDPPRAACRDSCVLVLGQLGWARAGTILAGATVHLVIPRF